LNRLAQLRIQKVDAVALALDPWANRVRCAVPAQQGCPCLFHRLETVPSLVPLQAQTHHQTDGEIEALQRPAKKLGTAVMAAAMTELKNQNISNPYQQKVGMLVIRPGDGSWALGLAGPYLAGGGLCGSPSSNGAGLCAQGRQAATKAASRARLLSTLALHNVNRGM